MIINLLKFGDFACNIIITNSHLELLIGWVGQWIEEKYNQLAMYNQSKNLNRIKNSISILIKTLCLLLIVYRERALLLSISGA